MDRGIWCCEYQVTVDLGTIRSRQAKCGLDQRAYKGLLKKGEMAIYLGDMLDQVVYVMLITDWVQADCTYTLPLDMCSKGLTAHE